MSLLVGGKPDFSATHADKGLFDYELQKKSGTRVFGASADVTDSTQRKNFDIVISSLDEKTARAEAERCLYCNDVCNVCVTVCPNRANFSYEPIRVNWRLSKIVDEGGKAIVKDDRAFIVGQDVQTANIADFCNECGNCETFCPTAGAPYRDKPKMCLTEESFASEPTGFIIGKINGKNFIRANVEGSVQTLVADGKRFIFESPAVSAVFKGKDFAVISAELKNGTKEADLGQAATMAVLLKSLADRYLYR
jgi:putative selenate reductase